MKCQKMLISRKLRFIVIIGVVFCCFWLSAFGQVSDSIGITPKKLKVPSVGIALTGSAYTGDLSDALMKFNRIYPGVNFSLQSNVNSASFLKLQLNAGLGSIAEQADKYPFTQDHPKGVRPSIFVYTPYYYGDFRIKTRLPGKYIFRPYLSTGIGLYLFSPQDEDGNLLIDAPKSRPLSELYNTASFYLPATIGLDIRLNAIASLGLDYSYLRLFTDYTDNLGELGLQQGVDALHRLQLAMYITPVPLETKIRIPDIYIPPVDTTEYIDTLVITSTDKPKRIRKNRKPKGEEAVVVTDTAAHFFVPRPLDSLILSLLDTVVTPTSSLKKETLFREDTLTIFLDSSLYVLDSGKVYPASRKYKSLTRILSGMQDSLIFKEEENITNQELYVNKNIEKQKDSLTFIKMENWEKIEPEIADPNMLRQRQKALAEREKYLIENKKFIYYEVRRMDNLDIIAKKFQVQKTTILRLNSMTSQKVEAGTILRLPDMEYNP